MAIRWGLCTVVNKASTADFPITEGITVKIPKAAEYAGLNLSTVAFDGVSWCLVRARGTAAALSAADSDPDVIHLLEVNLLDNFSLNTTLEETGASNARLIRIRNRLIDKGVDVTGLNLQSTIGDVLQRVLNRLADLASKPHTLSIQGMIA